MQTFFCLILAIFFLISFIHSQITLSYGQFQINTFKDQFCSEKNTEIQIPSDTQCFQYNDEQSIYIYNWDPYSYSLNYVLLSPSQTCEEIEEILNSEEEEEEEEEEGEELIKFTFLCNGHCVKENIQTDPETDNYYTCVYNNFHPNLTFKIRTYKDSKCKTNIINKQFPVNESCWEMLPLYSIAPLYWEDNNKRLYYTSYNNSKENCYGGSIDIQKTFMICNGQCFKNRTDQRSSYRCNKSNASFLSYNQLIYILILSIII